MTANPETSNTNICGVLVQIHPEQRELMEARLLEIDGLEIHAASEEGKLVVTVEADSYGAAGDALNYLHTVRGVLSASLIYHHSEELEAESQVETTASESQL